MKKNVNINISGIIFNIEEDGYDRLRVYLDEIKLYFATYDDTGEIAADIENRVAEIFLSRLNPHKQVITAADVESLIAQMGNVKDFEAIEEPAEPSDSYAHTSQPYEKESVGADGRASYTHADENGTAGSRKLYRDGKRKVIAGVASGIAHYFRIDAFWIRLLFLIILLDLFISFSFSSALLIGYIVLWIVVPERFDLSEDKKIRKMFRDPDRKVIGGVASGLAAYFGVDPTLIRVLFILTVFLGGSGLIAYIILWIITPEAVTLTDRMQMQGEPLTLSNIEQNIKKNLNLREGEETGMVRALLFPFRLVSAVFSGAGRAINPLIRFLGDLIRIVAGGILILLGFGFLLSLMIIASFLAGIFPETYTELFEWDLPGIIMEQTVPATLLVSSFISLFIPGLVVILLGIAIIAKRWLLNATASWVLFALWIINLLVSAFSIPAFVVDFKEKDYYESESSFAADTTQTMVLNLKRGSTVDFDEVVLSLKPSEENIIRLEKRFFARGRNSEAAKALAMKTLYEVEQLGDTLLFSPGIRLPENTPYRGQKLEGSLYIPVGQKFRINHDMRRIFPYTLSQYGYSSDDLKNKPVFMFNKASELVCLNCPEREVEEEKWRSDRNSGEFVREINAKDFQRVSVGSNYKVFLQQSPEYRIRLEGEKDAVNSLEFEQEGNTVHFRNSFSFFDGEQDRVTIYISLPELESLNVSGAAEAELSKWVAPRMELDLSGASEIRLEGEVEELETHLSGSSELNLSGKGRRLEADLSGSSQLNALEYRLREGRLDLSGASYAGVYADDQIEVDASGASHLEYKGNPSTQIDQSHGSRVEKQDD